MLARICSSALRPRGEVRVPVSHRGDPASIVLRLWKAVCPQSPWSPSAVTAAHRVRAGGPQKGQPSPLPPHAEAPTPQVLRPAPSTAAWPDGGSRPSRQRHPITCPPWTGRWPPRCECVCRAVPEAPPRVAASRLDAALAPGHSRDRANVATVPAPAHSQCLAVAAGSRGCGNGPGVARDRLQATTVPRGEQ